VSIASKNVSKTMKDVVPIEYVERLWKPWRGNPDLLHTITRRDNTVHVEEGWRDDKPYYSYTHVFASSEEALERMNEMVVFRIEERFRHCDPRNDVSMREEYVVGVFVELLDELLRRSVDENEHHAFLNKALITGRCSEDGAQNPPLAVEELCKAEQILERNMDAFVAKLVPMSVQWVIGACADVGCER